ncbi:hypothetical protein ACFPGO_01350 [Arcanobacterium canis]
MMFRRENIPSFIEKVFPQRPTSAAPLADGRWVAAWPTMMAIVSETSQEVFEWSEFEYGRWNEEKLELILVLTERGQTAPLTLQLVDGSDHSVVTMVRERIDRSVIYQVVRELPSGSVARGQVRRNGHEELFTEILTRGQVPASDIDALNDVETELREAVGLPLSKNL